MLHSVQHDIVIGFPEETKAGHFHLAEAREWNRGNRQSRTMPTRTTPPFILARRYRLGQGWPKPSFLAAWRGQWGSALGIRPITVKATRPETKLVSFHGPPWKMRTHSP